MLTTNNYAMTMVKINQNNKFVDEPKLALKLHKTGGRLKCD